MSAFRLDDVVAYISDNLPTFHVRVSAMQNTAHFLAELKAVNSNRLPLVIVVFDGVDFNEETICAETRISLILVDQFRADSDDRARSLFKHAADLMALFPILGKQLGEAFITPEDVRAASVDPNFAAIVLGLRVQQRAR